LPFLRQLTKAVEGALHLVDDRRAGGVGVAGEEIGVALRIIRGVDATDAAISGGAYRNLRCAGVVSWIATLSSLSVYQVIHGHFAHCIATRKIMIVE